MKKGNLLLFASVAIIVLTTSFAAFYPGSAPAGYTGSPGDGSNCSACHGTAATTTAGWITSNIPAAGYTPGQSYQITATNNMTGSGKYGFEISPQNSSGTLMGTLTAGTNSTLVGSGKYITHNSASSTIKTWTFTWVAPSAGSGSVTFYGAFARNYSGLTTLSTLVVAENSASVPAAAGPITGSSNVCSNTSSSYSVSAISGATSYVWSVPSGATIASGQGTTAITINYGVSAVSGNVSVYGTNGSGNGTASNLAITVGTVPAQPTTIAGSATPCQASSQVYSVTNVAGVTYAWVVPAGWSITAGQGTSSITATVGTANGNVQVTPSNTCGNGTARTLAVTVSTVAAQPTTIAGSASPCQASSQVYSVTNVAGVTYAWVVPAGWSITAGQGTSSITATVGTANGNVQVTPSNTCGNGTARTLAVTVSTLPAQPTTIAGSVTPCQASSQVYSVTNVAGVTYAWVVPAGWSITAGQGTSSITATVGTANGNVQVTPSNTCGNGTARTLAVTVSTVPAQPTTIAGSATPCQASSQVYSVTNVAGVTYAWVVPAGWSITAGQGTNSITATVGTANGNVQVTPSNTCGNGTARTLAVTVSTVPAQPATIAGSATPCQASSQVYSVTNVAGVTYAWVVPAGWSITAGQGTNSITATVGTANGNVQVTPSNSCGNGSLQTKAVTVLLTPGISASIAGTDKVDLLSVATSDYTAAVAANAASYQWELTPAGAGTIIGTGITATVTWNKGYSGTANVRVKAINTCGEGGWSQVKAITVIITTGINQVASVPEMNVYPSPSSGNFTVALNGMKDRVNLRILDLTGHELYNTRVSGNEATQLEYQLAPGMYLVQVYEGKNKITKKLIVR